MPFAGLVYGTYFCIAFALDFTCKCLEERFTAFHVCRCDGTKECGSRELTLKESPVKVCCMTFLGFLRFVIGCCTWKLLHAVVLLS